jgi:hypothetical protein
VPAEIVFATGVAVKVIADSGEVARALAAGDSSLETARFAGFRGDEAVGGEAVVVNVSSIAYAIAITGP